MSKKKKFTIRFNLGKGKNYMKWKVTDPDGKVEYYDPNKVTIHMHRCKLVNHKTTAKKIFDGSNKSVCAWIEADVAYAVFLRTSKDREEVAECKVSYNPRIAPHWIMEGENADNKQIHRLLTCEREVYKYKYEW